MTVLILGYVGNKDILDIELQEEVLINSGSWEIYNKDDNDLNKSLLRELILYSEEKDIFMVYSLGCLGLSLKESISFIYDLSIKNIDFISVKDSIDTTKKEGDHIFKIFEVLENRQREIDKSKVKKGLKAIKARGLSGGRPKKDRIVIEKAISLYLAKKYSINEIVKSTGVSKSTLYRELAKKKNITLSNT